MSASDSRSREFEDLILQGPSPVSILLGNSLRNDSQRSSISVQEDPRHPSSNLQLPSGFNMLLPLFTHTLRKVRK